MVINELKQVCPRCKGSGYMPGFSALGINQINYDGRCPGCAGRGFLLTELGEQLVGMLRPFMREMLEEARGLGPARPPQESEQGK